MQPQPERRQTRNPPRPRQRLAFLGVLILSVILQSVAPMPVLARQADQVIEICGAYGVSEIRLDADGNAVPLDQAPCSNCRECPLCMIAAASDLPGETSWHRNAHASLKQAPTESDTHTESPARFWADNRGPPARTEKAKHLAMKDFMGPPRIEGRAPWM